ncbi:MAG: SDR family oxidoreductase [Chitinivibrionales bacterium]|nr:SDR family oxidoreductase [Chitinivibrionales bacterium]
MPDLTQFDLSGKSALVTGANTGIGFGVATGLAGAGATVYITGRDTAKNNNALASLQKLNSSCRCYRIDFNDLDAIDTFYAGLLKESGGIDVLVNNAAMQCRGRADEIDINDFEKTTRVNVTAPYKLSQCFARERIRSRREGSMIFTASLMSEASRPTTSVYTSTKGSVRQLIKALAVDWAPFGIRVNGVGPGYIRTAMTEPLWRDDEFDAWVHKRTPLGRWGEIEDFEGAAIFLASDASRFVTGQILYVDGGWLATF